MMLLAQRILSRTVSGPNSCVLWTGAKTPKGYGQIRFEGRLHAVHRVVFEASKGPIPDGLEIDHLCRVRNCVNPEHLEAVTHAENNRRSIRNRRSTCTQGHPMTPENVYERRNGDRECRTCRRSRDKAWKRRKSTGSSSPLAHDRSAT